MKLNPPSEYRIPTVSLLFLGTYTQICAATCVEPPLRAAIDLRWRSVSMADQRRRVEDMTKALSILLKLQQSFNKEYTQEEADNLVQQALMQCCPLVGVDAHSV